MSDHAVMTAASLKGDTAAALDFLQRMYPEGPWVLTSIETDRKAITTATFGPAKIEECRAWIDRFNGKRNIYWSVNPPMRELQKKAEREDIKEVVFLHVDIDPRAGEDLAEERERLLGLLTDRLPKGVPAPTAVVFSGGGYQGFWRLQEPIPINGEEAAYEDAKRYNQQLEILFGGDNCHNIDRIMRLPGTINIPDANKRRKGRTEALARVEAIDPTRAYPIEMFTAAPARVGVGKGEQPSLRDSLTPETVRDIDDLDQWKVPTRVKVAIVQGRDPDQDLSGNNSRSEWVHYVACNLARRGVPPEVVAGILLDPGFGISESVREKRDPAKYAARQVERAFGAVEADWAVTDKHGNPIKSYPNTRAAILRLAIHCEHDEFHGRRHVRHPALGRASGELSDRACTAIRQLILDQFRFDPGKEHVYDAAACLCDENPVDPVSDYLDTLVWDGEPRLDAWLSTYLGAADTALNRAFGRLTLVAAVRRARRPGFKFDFIPVLEGSQGSGKSSALRILAGEQVFSDQELLQLDARAQQEAVQGVWIYELGELAGLRQADVEKVKAFASRTHDRARPAYGRLVTDQPRRCIFIGTTNKSQYLRDATGNRRFWPIETGRIDTEALALDRDQLWAEAAALEAQGELLTLDPALYADASAMQEARREDDPWLDRLRDVTGARYGDEERVSSARLLVDVLHIPLVQQSPQVAQRLADCMRRLGWELKKLRVDGAPVKGYARRWVAREREPF